MSIRLVNSSLHVLPMKTRMPFKYGIASLTALPHVFLSVEVEIDGKQCRGLSSEGLPPKWFTKIPQTHFREDLEEMLDVIHSARSLAANMNASEDLFTWWHELYLAQREWGQQKGYPPLLWNLGVSLVERAMIDAFCRCHAVSFSAAVRDNRFGIRPGNIHPELGDMVPSEWLPKEPLSELIARHTVGLGDPLDETDLTDENRIQDGLPQTLEQCIRQYGLSCFKIKIMGKLHDDLTRLGRIAQLLERETGGNYFFTLDGNEQFESVATFREFWTAFLAEPQLKRFRKKLVFVEQPLHRSVALSEVSAEEMLDWDERPPTIIDESDGDLEALPTALKYGYVGTSHKNCKGVFKGIINACLIAKRNQTDDQNTYVISGEDLANVGPVALLQDLTVMSSLGISHVERNGHHYFAGLSMYPHAVQQDMLQKHPALYEPHNQGFATLRIRDGKLDCTDVICSPFGVGIELDTQLFIPIADWSAESLDY